MKAEGLQYQPVVALKSDSRRFVDTKAARILAEVVVVALAAYGLWYVLDQYFCG